MDFHLRAVIEPEGRGGVGVGGGGSQILDYAMVLSAMLRQAVSVEQ
jgi:hypothetical protein